MDQQSTESKTPHLRVSQLNAQLSKLAANSLRQTAFEAGYQILLLQEPYLDSRGLVSGYGLGPRVIQVHYNCTSAIVVKDDSLVGTRILYLCPKYGVFAEVRRHWGAFHVASELQA